VGIKLYNLYQAILKPGKFKKAQVMMVSQGKTVFITGASRGIGRGTAKVFAQEGAQVILVSRTESDQHMRMQLDVGAKE
jgi:NADPH:quinone reductase-like Zn-dependent oxidoreductase